MIDALVKLQDRNCLKDGSSVIHMFERLETGDPYKTFKVPDYDFTATKELGAVDDSLQRYIYILKVLNKIGKEAEKKGVVIAEIKSPYYTSFRGTVKPKLKKDAVMFEMTKENKNKLPENLKRIIEPEIFPVSKVKDCKDKQSSAVKGQTKEKVEKVISEIDRQLESKKLSKAQKVALQKQKQEGKDMLSGKKKAEPENLLLLPKEQRKPLDPKKTQRAVRRLASIYDGSFFESLKSPKKKAEPEKKDNELDNLYNALNDLLTRKANKRARGQFEKQFPNQKIAKKIFDIIDIQKSFDFFPTPKECLTRLIPPDSATWRISENYLEGTAGLGSITHFIHQNDPKAKITAVELTETLSKTLKELQPNVNVINKDFLKIPIDTFKDIDTIVLNPPFSNAGDKRFYYDFLFRGLAILNNALQKGNKGEKHLYFISPELIEINRLTKVRDTIPSDKLYSDKRLGAKKLSEIIKDISGKAIRPVKVKETMINQDSDLFSDVYQLFDIQQLQYLGTCEGFGGTKIQAHMYLFIICC